MDGASKFVRGDAVAGIIILAVNIFGGIIIGATRHGMAMSDAADVYTKLSVGDGLVSQIPALIVSLAAALLVSKGGTRGSADKAVLSQLAHYPRALWVAALLMGLLALVPGLPIFPFAVLGGLLAFTAWAVPRRRAEELKAGQAIEAEEARAAQAESANSIKESLKTVEIELVLGRQLSGKLLGNQGELGMRVAKLRRKFATQYGVVVPDIKVSDNLVLAPKSYQIKIHGTVVAQQDARLGEVLVVTGEGRVPSVPGTPMREPSFGMKAVSIAESFAADVERDGFKCIDIMSVILTHLGETVRNNLAQLLSYKDLRALLDRMEPEYKRLVDEIIPAHLSHSGLQAILKLLLAERVSIRNIHLILEAIAEIVPHVRRSEQVVEHVRMRVAQQICGDLSENGELAVLRLGPRWDLAFAQSLKRDPKTDTTDFDLDPRMVEQFGTDASPLIRQRMDAGLSFVLLATPETRIYVRMIVERMFATLPVLSHLEIARGVQIKTLGALS